MKTKKLNTKNLLLFFTLLASGLLFYFWGKYDANIQIKNVNNKTIELLKESLGSQREIIDSLEAIDSTRKAKTFSYVHSAMRRYNPDIKKETVQLFINITGVFDLDSTETLFNTCISQLLYESGAQQRYSSRHPKSGKLVISSANAIGISQITPPTSYDYLMNSLKTSDHEKLIKLGCDDFKFIEDRNYNTSTKKQLITWLSNEKNNLILWGYIMSKSISKRNGNVDYALIAYNGGPGHLRNYIARNHSTWNHKYVRKIKSISKHLGA